MNKLLANLALKLQKEQGFALKTILAANEMYIRFYALFLRRNIKVERIEIKFSANHLELVMRRLDASDIPRLEYFFKHSINTKSAAFIMPHRTDRVSLQYLFGKTSHIPMGIFCGDALVGYALIRLLFPDRASYSIFVADNWQGKGIGTAALEMQLGLIKDLKFKPYSAVCKNNARSIGMLKKLNIEFTQDLGDCFEVKDMGCRRR
ncbi:MAG: GNAT family N-acetyltransferase [Candidatus Omnitrophica bacterium]|nr:GNAT family N-acetyltransferase [Candidatus Omnitrophota bacterium]